MHLKLFIVSILFSASAFSATNYQTKLQQWERSPGPLAKKLERLYNLQWDYQMNNYPEWATFSGYPGLNDKLTDMSFEAIEQRKKDTVALDKAISKISEKELKGEDLISFQIFKRSVKESVEGQAFPSEYLALNQMSGIQTEFADLFVDAPKRNFKDYQDQLARLKLAPKKIEQVHALLKKGLEQKITPPKVVLQPVPKQFDAVTNPDLDKNPIYTAFREIKGPLTDEQKKEVQNTAAKIIREEIIPAYKKLQTFINQEYLPGCRENVAWSSLPNGQAWYQFLAKVHTTTDMPVDEIHNLGLTEVARLRAEMEKIKNQVNFKGSLAKFDQFLKEDNRFYYTNANDLMLGYRDLAKRIDPELPRFFGTLPRLPYGVREMPAYKAPASPTAYYMGGNLENGQAGNFEANTYDLKARPKWQMEALTLHEAVPGHHLQISLGQEIKGLPKFRTEGGHTVFVEGWGLYAEGLGDDLGLYKDPYSKYGQYTMEIWRAIRLVVDTGLHSKGWTRDQVMQYFRDNGPFTEQQIINETDRYIADPGQALAYKIGQLKFLQLREEAKKALGEKFDIRKFHDEVLGSGSLPVGILEAKVHRWMKTVSM
jgi:uncharacterized protein (DUF885 family)